MTDKEIEVIIKPIFIKMFKADFSVCKYGIECYKKGMEYQGIKELVKENDNLIKRIAHFENQIEKMKSDVKEMAEQADKNGDMLALKRMNELFEKWEIKEK